MRIYVSSSFVDLKDYRAAVLTAIRGLSHEYLAMEDYEAEDQLPKAKATTAIARQTEKIRLVQEAAKKAAEANQSDSEYTNGARWRQSLSTERHYLADSSAHFVSQTISLDGVMRIFFGFNGERRRAMDMIIALKIDFDRKSDSL